MSIGIGSNRLWQPGDKAANLAFLLWNNHAVTRVLNFNGFAPKKRRISRSFATLPPKAETPQQLKRGKKLCDSAAAEPGKRNQPTESPVIG